MQLYIIRHAQSINNMLWAQHGTDEGRQPDPDLSELGRQQAERLAEYMAHAPENAAQNGRDLQNREGYNLTHLYTSLMVRAVNTGQAVARATGLPLVAWEEIHEWGGIFEIDPETAERRGLPGPNRAYFTAHFPELALPETLGEAGWWNRPFETAELRQARTRRFLDGLLARHGDTQDRVAIVTHGGFTHSLLQEVLQIPDETRRFWFLKNNTAISRLDFHEKHVEIVYLNRVEHLPAEMVT